MVRLLSLFTLLLMAALSNAQQNFTGLKDALKSLSKTENLIITADEGVKLEKFYRRKNKFTNLESIYLQKGLPQNVIKQLLDKLNTIEFATLYWECDSTEGSIALLSGIRQIEELHLLNTELLSPGELQNIKQLNVKELSLQGSSLQVDTVEWPAELSALKLNLENPDYEVLLNSLINNNKVSALNISIASYNDIPKNILKISGLQELELTDTKTIQHPDSANYNYTMWLSSGNNDVYVDYTLSEPLTNEMRAILISSFPGATVLQRDESPAELVMSKKDPFLISAEPQPINKLNPIVNGINEPAQVFNTYTYNITQLKLSSGSVVTIPDNAFVDEKGNPVEGIVDVSYREIKTPLDIMLRGVPMNYDSAGGEYQLQTAGAFEILAAQNGKPLKLAKGKQINIDFVGTDNLSRFNFYRLNENNRWEYVNTVSTVAAQTRPVRSRAEKDVAWETDTFSTPFDMAHFAERYKNAGSIYVGNKNSKSWWAPRTSGRRETISEKSIQHSVKLVPDRNFVKASLAIPASQRRDSVCNIAFTLSQKEVLKRNNILFPELRIFNNYVFYTEDEISAREFVRLYSRKSSYHDVRITYNEGDENCTITLKDKKGFTYINAKVAKPQNGSVKFISKKIFNWRYKKYMKQLAAREARFNRMLDNKIRDYYRAAGLTNKLDASVIKSLAITGLGIYNCDQIARIQAPVFTMKKPKIENENGEEIIPITVYVIDRNIDGVLTYYNDVSLNIYNTKKVVATDGQNVYYTSGAVSNAVGNNTIKMKSIPASEIKSAQQFAALIGL